MVCGQMSRSAIRVRDQSAGASVTSRLRVRHMPGRRSVGGERRLRARLMVRGQHAVLSCPVPIPAPVPHPSPSPRLPQPAPHPTVLYSSVCPLPRPRLRRRAPLLTPDSTQPISSHLISSRPIPSRCIPLYPIPPHPHPIPPPSDPPSPLHVQCEVGIM